MIGECNCSICTKKGILHLVTDPADFELLQGKDALTAYTFETGMAQHTFCSHCGMHAFYIPRSQPHRLSVNARCLDDIDGPSLKPMRFGGETAQCSEQAQAKARRRRRRSSPDAIGRQGRRDDPAGTRDLRARKVGRQITNSLVTPRTSIS